MPKPLVGKQVQLPAQHSLKSILDRSNCRQDSSACLFLLYSNKSFQCWKEQYYKVPILKKNSKRNISDKNLQVNILINSKISHIH